MVNVLGASALSDSLGDPDVVAEHLSQPLLVDVDSLRALAPGDAERLGNRIDAARILVVGVLAAGEDSQRGRSKAIEALSVTVTQDDLSAVVARIAAAPRASFVLDRVLRASEALPTGAALDLEAFAYSTLLGGAEFHSWLASIDHRSRSSDVAVVTVDRNGDRLEVTLDHPVVRNAFDAAMRDQLCEALHIAEADERVSEVLLRGRGPDFSSGGALWEFGTTDDGAEAATTRLARSPGERLARIRARVECRVQGACIGAGIELAAFADRLIGSPDTYAQLPELSMGLIPGAGGTVSVRMRIGRQRTAWMALTGARVDAETLLRWGLLDAVYE